MLWCSESQGTIYFEECIKISGALNIEVFISSFVHRQGSPKEQVQFTA